MMTLLLAIPVIVGTPPAQKAACPVAEARLTSAMIEGENAKDFHRLDREPPAQTYLTVARRIGACDVPMVVPGVLTKRP